MVRASLSSCSAFSVAGSFSRSRVPARGGLTMRRDPLAHSGDSDGTP